MGQHILLLNFPSVTEEGVIVVEDISVYDDILPVMCPTLQVTPPGGNSVIFDTSGTGWHTVLNACSIGLLPSTGCSESCPCLPDGIYNFRYSVAPNDQVFVEYNVMRTVQAMNRYFHLLCGLNIQCCIPDKELQYQLSQLDIIRNYILAAKLAVEECNRPEDGINILLFANTLMDKMSRCKPWC